ncbi:fimbrial protein [Burkholderia ubonensis]|uniref:fimbrial protein n=1 Tax=Burkholderia ubonensis TaxID=101571 RepID=UPI0007550989|nr:fimbrial protein [Burkholderia ubonensis]KVK99016.1 hypothetical protein WJ45_16230 [Burkholderia ubonensis]KVQ54212.1 hypothetical protein WK04_02975 [Burkholderia ubonensis]
MKKNFSTSVLFTGLLAASSQAFAAGGCHQLTQSNIDWITKQGWVAKQRSTFTVTFPAQTIDVDPDLAIGDKIMDATSPADGDYYYIWCDPPNGTLNFNFAYQPPLSVLGRKIYDTNVPGIGFKLGLVTGGGTSSAPFSSPAQIAPGGTPIDLPAGSAFRITLIKTANTIPSFSTVNFGATGRFFGDDGIDVININANNVNLRVLPKCQVDSDRLNVNFGPFGPANVSTADGPSQPVKFRVLCSGVTAPVSITAALMATGDSDNPDLIQNSGASYLGIRLKDTVTEKILRPSDPNSTLVVRPGGAMTQDFDLSATVLRTSAAKTPTAGKIDATAVIALTIL